MDADFSNERPGWVQGLFWVLWALLALAFVALAGCAALLSVEYGSPFFVIGLIAGLIIFGFAVKLSFQLSELGRPRLLASATVMMLAAFVVFGSCTLGFGP